MKVSFAIKKILKLLRVPQAKLSKEADISSSNLSRIITESQRDVGMANVKKIADGLEKIDIAAKPLFYILLSMPDELEERDQFNPSSLHLEAHEYPEVIELILQELFDIGLLTSEMIEEKSKHPNSIIKELGLAQYISCRLQKKRLYEK
jgi:transcriptional regulator with XRE-family HTH domain